MRGNRTMFRESFVWREERKVLRFRRHFRGNSSLASFERKIAELCEAGPISDLKIAAAPQKLLQS